VVHPAPRRPGASLSAEPPTVDAPAAADPQSAQRGAGRPPVYFPGLDGLRFAAAALVIVDHLEQRRSVLRLPNHYEVTFVHRIGPLGVTLFFVLSGFLITYLLLEERAVSGTISVRGFYVRRILRIWPLYFLLVGLGFFVFPHVLLSGEELRLVERDFGAKLAAFLLMGPNVALVLWRAIPLVNHLWSIGTEEQFYLAWPWVVRLAKERLVGTLVGIVLAIGLLRWGFQSGTFATGNAATAAGRFLDYFRIDCMAIGGLGAWALHRGRARVLAAVFHPVVRVAAYVALAVLLATGRMLPVAHHQTYSTLFLVLILDVAAHPSRFRALESPTCRFMGRISYGLYMYHPAAIACVLAFAPRPAGGLGADLVDYGATFLLTTAVAAASYYGMERWFLRHKSRFTVVASGRGSVAA
jgi:peptidoglycan/LPS O-acetylase OafA/YrhL